jgi:hypothetical protein
MTSKCGGGVAAAKETKRAGHPANVYVLVIEHRHGDDLYVCRTQRSARTRLDEYVREWWDHEMPDRKMPKKRQERILEYFAEMSDRQEKEFYTISESELL